MEEGHNLTGKGKSLGSKKINITKEKYDVLTDKRGKGGIKSRAEATKMNFKAELDEYY